MFLLNFNNKNIFLRFIQIENVLEILCDKNTGVHQVWCQVKKWRRTLRIQWWFYKPLTCLFHSFCERLLSSFSNTFFQVPLLLFLFRKGLKWAQAILNPNNSLPHSLLAHADTDTIRRLQRKTYTHTHIYPKFKIPIKIAKNIFKCQRHLSCLVEPLLLFAVK